MRMRWFAGIAIVVGIAESWFAVQLRTWHGRASWVGEPTRKVLLWTWLESELWVDPILLAIGAATVIVAIVLLVVTHRRPEAAWARRLRPDRRVA